MLKKIFEKYKKFIIVFIVFTAIVLTSFIATVISLSERENKTNNLASDTSTKQAQSLASNTYSSAITETITTPTRDVSPYSNDYDKSLDDIKNILKSNKWRGKGKYNVDEGKEYSFSFDNDDIAVISSPQEKENVLINMKYVKSVNGKYNTYRVICDLSFQDGKYITDSTLIITFKNSSYELRCDDFPLYQRFCIKEW